MLCIFNIAGIDISAKLYYSNDKFTRCFSNIGTSKGRMLRSYVHYFIIENGEFLFAGHRRILH